MNRYLAECFGTFTLVFCGTGAVVVDQVSGGTVTHLGIAITFGLVVVALIYAIGDLSGAHINPAVTVAFAAAGTFPWKKVPPYILSQCLGALLASGTLRLLFPEATTLGATLPAGPVAQSFVLEFLLTLFLMFIIIQVATGSKEVGMMAGLAIGFTVLLEALFAGPICGASMNPARSLGPAVVSANLEHLWVYLTAPFLGALAGVGVWWGVREK